MLNKSSLFLTSTDYQVAGGIYFPYQEVIGFIIYPYFVIDKYLQLTNISTYIEDGVKNTVLTLKDAASHSVSAYNIKGTNIWRFETVTDCSYNSGHMHTSDAFMSWISTLPLKDIQCKDDAVIFAASNCYSMQPADPTTSKSSNNLTYHGKIVRTLNTGNMNSKLSSSESEGQNRPAVANILNKIVVKDYEDVTKATLTGPAVTLALGPSPTYAPTTTVSSRGSVIITNNPEFK
jgi:hypothetical protein